MSGDVAHGSGEYLSISGGRPSSNVYMVDGLVINDMANRAPAAHWVLTWAWMRSRSSPS